MTPKINLLRSRGYSWAVRLAIVACVVVLSAPAFAAFVITPTFTAGFNASFGANAAAAQAAWIAAAKIFTDNFTDNIHANIIVDGVAGTTPFGQSNTFLGSVSYTNLRNAVVADVKTADDTTSTGAGGSVAAADPVAVTHTWWVSRAQAKALGLLADDLANDGTTTFGAGNPFTFSGAIAAGTYDFRAVAAHEISEVLGRLGLSGDTVGASPNSYSLMDSFSYSGAGARVLGKGANSNFSINNGTNLLKLYNNAAAFGLDSRDWAPLSQGGSGAPDAFNQFSDSGVTNPVTEVDFRTMDVIGYDRVAAVVTPEPSTVILLVSGLASVGFLRRRKKA